MKTFECPGCGNIITESEQCCKYCGNANPNFVTPKSTVTSRLFSQQTASTPVGSPTANPVTQEDGGSFFLGLILGLFLNWIGILVALLAIRKKRTTKGSIVGFASEVVLIIIIYIIVFSLAF